MAERWAETGIFTACETQTLNIVSGGSVLDGLPLSDWSQGNLISSDNSLTATRGFSRANWHVPEWGCQSPSPRATSAHHQCVAPLLSLSASDTADEVHTTWDDFKAMFYTY